MTICEQIIKGIEEKLKLSFGTFENLIQFFKEKHL